MKRYTVGGHDWHIVIEDVHGDYPLESVRRFEEKHHAYLKNMDVGDTCTADLLADDGVRCAFVRKGDNGAVMLDPMVFEFNENGKTVEREMTDYIEVR